MTQPAARLLRGVGRWSLVALFINVTIGAGIFGLPSKVYALVGPYSLLTYLICAALIGLIVMCFAEVGSRFTETGGSYLYVHAAFGAGAGFVTGWLMWLRTLFAFAALSNLFVVYLGHFWPAAEEWRVAVIAGVLMLLNAPNLRGVRETARFSNLLTVGKLAALALFVLAGAFVARSSSVTLGPLPTQQAFATAALLLIFAFQGFERVLVVTGEVRDSRRNIPFALFTAIGVVTVLYVAIQLICILSLPDLARSERPLVDASRRLLGGAGASGIAIAALVSILGALTITVLAGPRVLFAMSEQGQLPRVLSAVHPRFRTPHVAILVTACLMLVVSLASTFLSALTIASLIIVLVYAATCAALPVLRRKHPDRDGGFRVPAGVPVALVSVALCLWLMTGSSWRELRDVAIAAALGLALYAARGRPRTAVPERAVAAAAEGQTPRAPDVPPA